MAFEKVFPKGHKYEDQVSFMTGNLELDTQAFYSLTNQPTPFPLNPPENLSSKFGFLDGQQTIFLSWTKPKSFVSCGAWQDWTYNLYINNNKVSHVNDSFYSFEVNNDVNLEISIEAESSGGLGPRSRVYKVRTWPDLEQPPVLYTLKNHKIESRNMMGDLIDESYLENQIHLEVTQNQSFITSNGSHVYHGQELIFESLEGHIESIFYERFAGSVYLNIPSQKLLLRKPLNCGTCLDKILLKGAKQVQMDSNLAKLCWIEFEKSVKCMTLPYIKSHESIFKIKSFGESVITSLSMDSNTNKLYFTVTSMGKTDLYQHDLLSNVTKISELRKQRPKDLQCLFSKCFWRASGKLFSYELNSNNRLEELKVGDVINFKVQITKSSSVFNVIPKSLQSLHLEGNKLSWNTFSQQNLTFDINISSKQKSMSFKNKEDNFLDLEEFMEDLPPYTPFNVSVTSQTPWATSEKVLKKLFHTPMTEPSAPQHLMVYQEPIRFSPFENNSVQVQYFVHWDRPLKPNGPIQNYVLSMKCSDGTCQYKDKITGDRTSYKVNATRKLTSFKLHAQNNQVLSGPFTQFDAEVKPVPKLLLCDHNGVKLYDMTSKQLSFILPLQLKSPKVVSYSAQKNSIWIIDGDKLFEANLEQESTPIVQKMSTTFDAALIDPVGGYLYSALGNKTFRSSLSNVLEQYAIYESNEPIRSFAMESSANQNLFVVTLSGRINMLLMENDGSVKSTEDIIGNYCNVLNGPVLDDITIFDDKLYFIMLKSSEIWSFDTISKSCSRIGLIPSLDNRIKDFTAVSGQFWWRNESTNTLWNLDSGEMDTKKYLKSSVFCPSCQILSSENEICLKPDEMMVTIPTQSSNHVELLIHEFQFDARCQILMPQIQVNVKFNLEDKTSFKQRTFHMKRNDKPLRVIIDDLIPYKSYNFEISTFSSLGKMITKPFKIKTWTLAGPPSPPRNVEVLVLSPKSIKVSWLPSLIPNGPEILYEIHYQTEDIIETFQTPKIISRILRTKRSKIIKDLKPSKEYKIWVVAVANTNSSFATKSEFKIVKTYNLPNYVNYTEVTPRSFRILWTAPETDIQSHQFKIENKGTNFSVKLPENPEKTEPGPKVYSLENLSPGLEYNVTMILRYKSTPGGYRFDWKQGKVRFFFIN